MRETAGRAWSFSSAAAAAAAAPAMALRSRLRLCRPWRIPSQRSSSSSTHPTTSASPRPPPAYIPAPLTTLVDALNWTGHHNSAERAEFRSLADALERRVEMDYYGPHKDLTRLLHLFDPVSDASRFHYEGKEAALEGEEDKFTRTLLRLLDVAGFELYTATQQRYADEEHFRVTVPVTHDWDNVDDVLLGRLDAYGDGFGGKGRRKQGQEKERGGGGGKGGGEGEGVGEGRDGAEADAGARRGRMRVEEGNAPPSWGDNVLVCTRGRGDAVTTGFYFQEKMDELFRRRYVRWSAWLSGRRDAVLGRLGGNITSALNSVGAVRSEAISRSGEASGLVVDRVVNALREDGFLSTPRQATAGAGGHPPSALPPSSSSSSSSSSYPGLPGFPEAITGASAAMSTARLAVESGGGGGGSSGSKGSSLSSLGTGHDRGGGGGGRPSSRESTVSFKRFSVRDLTFSMREFLGRVTFHEPTFEHVRLRCE